MRLSATRSHVDREMVEHVITHLRLVRIEQSMAVFGGDCPMCGHARSFVLWAEKATYRCFWCGADGRFVRAVERPLIPERETKLINGTE